MFGTTIPFEGNWNSRIIADRVASLTFLSFGTTIPFEGNWNWSCWRLSIAWDRSELLSRLKGIETHHIQFFIASDGVRNYYPVWRELKRVWMFTSGVFILVRNYYPVWRELKRSIAFFVSKMTVWVRNYYPVWRELKLPFSHPGGDT